MPPVAGPRSCGTVRPAAGSIPANLLITSNSLPFAYDSVKQGWLESIADAGLPVLKSGEFPSRLVLGPVATIQITPWLFAYNTDKLKVATMSGVTPSVETIATGKYPVSRPLFFYVKKDHVGKIAGIKEYITEFTSDKAWGKDGYLAEKGLIAMPDAQRKTEAQKGKDLPDLKL